MDEPIKKTPEVKPAQIEIIKTEETARETSLTPEIEKITESVEKKVMAEAVGASVSIPVALPSLQQASIKDVEQKEIEEILSEGLAKIYEQMPRDAQIKFKARGEIVAAKIKEMFKTAKIRAKGVWTLIREWLKMIPGVNRFFLEQESKIKTDKILEYAEKKNVKVD